MHIEEYLDRIAQQQNVMRVWASWPVVRQNDLVIVPANPISDFWAEVEAYTRLRNNVSMDYSNWHSELCLNYEWDSTDFGPDDLQMSFKLCLYNIVRHLFYGSIPIESYHEISQQQGLVENNMQSMLDEIYEMFENVSMEITCTDMWTNLLNQRIPN